MPHYVAYYEAKGQALSSFSKVRPLVAKTVEEAIEEAFSWMPNEHSWLDRVVDTEGFRAVYDSERGEVDEPAEVPYDCVRVQRTHMPERVEDWGDEPELLVQLQVWVPTYPEDHRDPYRLASEYAAEHGYTTWDRCSHKTAHLDTRTFTREEVESWGDVKGWVTKYVDTEPREEALDLRAWWEKNKGNY